MHRRIVCGFLNSVRYSRAANFSPKSKEAPVESLGLGVSVALGASFSAKMHTRGHVVEKEKEKFLAMTIDERRDLYKCGSNYVTLSDVKTWPQYVKEMTDEKKQKTDNLKYEVNPKLNELVSIWRGDITKLEIDAIVNAANNRLLGGGGVDGAIHSAAGSSLTSECATLNGCETGDAKITLGYKLPASRVIHTVGPIGENAGKLKSCYKRCLEIVRNDKLKSVAFPCISTGIYGYPNRSAAEIAIETARKWLETEGVADKVERVIFCLFLEVDVNVYEELMQKYFPVAADDSKTAEEVSNKDSTEEEEESKKSTAECLEKKGEPDAEKEEAKTETEDKESEDKENKGKESEENSSDAASAAETKESSKGTGDGDTGPPTKL